MFFAWQSFFPRTRSELPGGDLRTEAFARQNRLASAAGLTELRRYLPGLAQQSVATGAVDYLFGDQIGTLRTMRSGGTPPVTTKRVYTAFGELVEMTGTGETRYGYAGVWGYQEHDADGAGGPDNSVWDGNGCACGARIGQVLPFLHVGWRYYDPATGRFLQRDPIGIGGGLNVYVYVFSLPTGAVDPSGLLSWFDFKVGVAKGYLWITGGDDSWLDDPAKVRKAQQVLNTVAEEAVLTACGVGIASHLSKFRHLRWLNSNRYFRIGPGKAGGGQWQRRIVIGGGKSRIHIPITRPRPIRPGGIPL